MVKYILVAITCYNAVPEQGWGDGTITADGTKITNPKEQKIVAVSHDLLKDCVSFGDTLIFGTEKYVVRDKMNKRHKRSVDILIPKDEKPFSKKEEIVIIKKKAR